MPDPFFDRDTEIPIFNEALSAGEKSITLLIVSGARSGSTAAP